MKREALHDDPAQPIQIHELDELDAVAERATCCDDWVFKMGTTDADSEINPRGCLRDACPLGRTHAKHSTTPVKDSARHRNFRSRIPPLRTRQTLC